MIIQNSTDIPTELIKVVIQFSAQAGIKLDKVQLRNKVEGHFYGQFGWYIKNLVTGEIKIRLIVPPNIPKEGMRIRNRYSNTSYVIKDRVEFIVAILSHELRHAWQLQTQLQFSGSSSRMKEIDAEIYEYRQLIKWRKLVNG